MLAFAVTIFCVAIICVGRYLNSPRRRLGSSPLPPGPGGFSWIGDVLSVNAGPSWSTFSKWAKTYGDLIYVRFLGNDVIIINSEKVAKDLLNHRSRNYSDRPHLLVNEACGLDFNTGLLCYGDRWQRHRRFLHQAFRSDAVSRFRPLQFHSGCQLLRELMDTPNRFAEHVFDYTVSVTMGSVYDYDSSSPEDNITEVVSKVLDVVTAVRPEVALVIGAFPWILHFPSWLPGMSFKKEMETTRELAVQYVERPFEYSVQRLLKVGAAPSMVHDSIRKDGSGYVTTDEAWMYDVKGAAASAFLGGAETSNSVLMAFFLMMILSPEAQEKAQAQIDLVLEGERLPTIDDRPCLPYIDAILREVCRYNPVVPLSLPHSVVEDDVYAGFHIPKGAVVLTNLWSMTRDESKYPNADKFVPERFLANDGSLLPNDTEHLVFGFGRRICPGRHFADASIWSTIATVLAVFRISKPTNADGTEMPFEPKFSSGLVLHPLPFECSIVPRRPDIDTEKLEQLIAATKVDQ